MATKRRTSSTKRKSNKPKAEDIRKAEEFRSEIILWIIIAVAALLFVSNFGVGGFVGNAVSAFVFGLVGIMAYVFPIVLVIACFFATSNRENFLAIVKLIAGIVFVGSVCHSVSVSRLIIGNRTIITL